VGGTGVITGGNVTLNSGGGVGTSDAAIQLAVGQAATDQLNLTAKGDVYIEQKTDTLPLVALPTTGDALITHHNRCVVNVNTNFRQDPRTVAQLVSGVWSALQLTGADAQKKIQQTLDEYQLYQEQQYQAYWTFRNSLVNSDTNQPTDINDPKAIVALSASELAYYQGVFAAQAQAKGLTGQDATDFVNSAILTLELSSTQQYYSLAAEFGPGGTYAPGTVNIYDASTNANISNISAANHTASSTDQSTHVTTTLTNYD